MISSGFSLSAVNSLAREPSIRILASKPHHEYQNRKLEVTGIWEKFKELKKDHDANCVVGVYITGDPGSGKTLVAREFGERYFKQQIRAANPAGTRVVVATLDARTPVSFLRSYFRLVEDLGLSLNKYKMPCNMQDRLRLLSTDVQKALTETAPNWLLIIDDIVPESKLANAFSFR